MNMEQLDAESAELLPGREALGKLKFSFVKTTHVTKNIAHVDAHNESLAANQFSPFAVAQSEAVQAINIRQ
ncbi:hypothetical protein PV703_32330 [Streptomyces sp. ME01-24h]|jgi:hypothetical protein|nr:hypothetical protein [Streptomyces sp. ME19-03-3]MDX3236427.1 hypothetical protein [Streptomyces sp. ME03-5709C]MDX3357894.1 hypothetical protein [Streptomyces sp. ME01-24h]